MITDIDINMLKNFKNYPFKLTLTENMKELIESIVINGIITPLIVRKVEDLYEIISGHRRKYVAELLNVKKIPCIVKEMNDNEAILAMIDCNIDREKILPSERAFAYRMKLEAIKVQSKRVFVFDVTPQDWKLENIEFTNEKNIKKINNYIRLTNLIPELLELVDIGRIAFSPALELSYLTKKNQKIVSDFIDMEDATPTVGQAIRMKKLELAGKLNEETIEQIMLEEKPNQKEKFTMSYDQLRKYLPNEYTNKQIEKAICRLLEEDSKK